MTIIENISRTMFFCVLVVAMSLCTSYYGTDVQSSTHSHKNVEVSQTPIPNNSATPLVKSSYALVDFNVKDVRIGAAKTEVLEKLGKPTKISKVKVDNFGEEIVLRLNYSGLEIDLSPDETGKNYFALSFIVSNENWDISQGIRIGAPFNSVVEKFGKPWNEEYNSATELLGYSAAPGNDVGELTFKGGKLRKAKWYVNPC